MNGPRQRPRFLTQTVATPAALAFIATHDLDMTTLLHRHFAGDWGILDPADTRANDTALTAYLAGTDFSRVLSNYPINTTDRMHETVWIITDFIPDGASITTVLLPEDY